jgi:hypothetical protein
MPDLADIQYVSPLEEVNSANDNIDVHIHLTDGRIYSLLVATPNNIYQCMASDGIDYYFGTPPLLVKSLTDECVKKAVVALLSEGSGRWLDVYGALQT